MAPNLIIASCGGDELPRKNEGPRMISYSWSEARKIPGFTQIEFTPDWSCAVNNKCNSGKLPDGRRVEEITTPPGSFPRYFIEGGVTNEPHA